MVRNVLMVSKKNIENRIEFANNHINWIDVERSKNGEMSYRQTKQKLTYFVMMAEILWDVHRTQNLCHNKPKTVKDGGWRKILWYHFHGMVYGKFTGPKIMDQHEYCNIKKKVMLSYTTEQIPVGWALW